MNKHLFREMPMRKISTLNYIIKTYQNNEKKEDFLSNDIFNCFNEESYEPSLQSVNSILDFARSYQVLNSANAGIIELNLN